jgi:hypothetical protein
MPDSTHRPPPQQRVLGGWVLRLYAGKAKRARCDNALTVGRMPLNELLLRAQAAFAQAGLPFIVRITPFTQPQTLDATLAARGFQRFDDAGVMVKPAPEGVPQLGPLPGGAVFEMPGHGAFADAVGQLRGSPLAHRQAHAERLRTAPVPYVGVLLSCDGELLVCGQMVIEDELVGLDDIFTAPAPAPAHRSAGLGRALCIHLLALARARGACCAYPQVDADNEPARQLYARLGFADGYAYHYRIINPQEAS